MNWSKEAPRVAASLPRIRGTRRSAGVTAIVAAVLATASLIAAGPASAASRGFDIQNMTGHAPGVSAVRLVLTDVFRPPLWPWNWPMRFEGRPDLGSVLEPDKTQRFEIGFWGNAAIAKYKVNDEWDVYFWMGSWLGTVSGCGFAKAGEPLKYVDGAKYPVNPGLLPDHAVIDRYYCKTDQHQELLFGDR